MIQAMYNGVSGLRAHKTELDVIGNNIANINTVGFKSSRVNFREMLSQTMKGASAPTAGGTGGTNPLQVGLGVGIGSIDVNQGQGSLLPTGSPSDVAIEGNGFLVLSDGKGKYYTRDGSFKLDGDGNLVSSASGLKVLGWAADTATGALNDTMPITNASSIRIPIGKLAICRQTTQITFGGNLNAELEAGKSYQPGAKVYDSLGVSHPLDISFTKTAPTGSQAYADSNVSTIGTGTLVLDNGSGISTSITIDNTNNTLQGACDAINALKGSYAAEVTTTTDAAGKTQYNLLIADKTGAKTSVDTSGLAAGTGTIPTFGSPAQSMWMWSASSPDAAAGSAVGGGQIVFDSQGNTSFGSGNITLDLANPNGARNPIDVTMSFMPITQKGGASDVRNTGDDGLPLGMLDNFTIGKDGIITGAFGNGMTQSLGRIAIAGFSNPAGLSRVGDNLLMDTSNTGVAEIGHPSVGSMGKLTSGFLESSNVDLPTEFANMIVAQRGFQANSKLISTSDEILQDIVQLKR